MFANCVDQARQEAYNAQHYKPASYKVFDEIFLSKRLFTTAASTAQPSMKLSVQGYGLFRVLQMIGKNAIKVELSKNKRVHPVIHFELTSLRKSKPSDIAAETRHVAQRFAESKGE